MAVRRIDSTPPYIFYSEIAQLAADADLHAAVAMVVEEHPATAHQASTEQQSSGQPAKTKGEGHFRRLSQQISRGAQKLAGYGRPAIVK